MLGGTQACNDELWRKEPRACIIDAILDAEVLVRTTVTVNDELVARASELTGRTEASALFRLGLEALVERESARRLAALGGSDPKALVAPRDRSNRG